jgi:hypothetical protein
MRHKVCNVIPKKAIEKYLPFSFEPLSEWSDKTDLLQFLYELFTQEAVVTGPFGRKVYSNYRSYGKYLFDLGFEYFKDLASQFKVEVENNLPKPGAKIIKAITHDFLKNKYFGKMAKSAMAWNAIGNQIFSENAPLSMTHLLETATEIKCSIFLAKNLFYKQAIIVLRSFLEELISPLFFSNNANLFQLWKQNQDTPLPNMRGRNGMLVDLKSRKIISKRLNQKVDKLYKEMNRYIHGKEEYLINKGMYTDQWKGLIFKEKEFKRWASYLSQTVAAGIKIVYAQLKIHAKHGPLN